MVHELFNSLKTYFDGKLQKRHLLTFTVPWCENKTLLLEEGDTDNEFILFLKGEDECLENWIIEVPEDIENDKEKEIYIKNQINLIIRNIGV